MINDLGKNIDTGNPENGHSSEIHANVMSARARI